MDNAAVAQTSLSRPDPFVPPAPIAQPISPVAPISPAPVRPPVTDTALVARAAELDRREAALDQRVAKRVADAKLTDKTVEAQIASEYAICAFDAFGDQPNIPVDADRALRCITIVVLVLRNGFSIVGSSVSAAPENYDANEGRKEAKADAMAKLWLVSEYAARNQLMGIDGPVEPELVR